MREELQKPVLGTFVSQVSDDEVIAKGLLYKTVRKHLDTIASQIDQSTRSIIW